MGSVPARSLNGLNEEVTCNVLRSPDASTEPIRLDNCLIKIKRRYDYETILDHSWGYLIEASVSGAHSSTALVKARIAEFAFFSAFNE